MNIKKQFNNLKSGAKKVLIGLMVLSLLSTATGIGTVFSYATEEEGIQMPSNLEENLNNTENGESGDALTNIDEEGDGEGGSEGGETGGEGSGTDIDAGDGQGTGEGAGEGGESRDSTIGDDTLNPDGTNSGEGSSSDGKSSTPSVEDCDHNYRYTSNGDGTHTMVCTICGVQALDDDGNPISGICDTYGDGEACSVCGYKSAEDGDHVHEYVYTYNGDETHTGVCQCGETKTEACDINTEWISDGLGHHVKKCSICEHVFESEDCDTLGEGGACSVCGYTPLRKMRTMMLRGTQTSNIEVPDDIGSALLNKAGLVLSTNLVYNGEDQVLATTQNSSTEVEPEPDGDYKWYFDSIEVNLISGDDCKKAGRKVFNIKVNVKRMLGDEQTDTGTWTTPQRYEVYIAPLDLSDNDISYSYNGSAPFSLKKYLDRDIFVLTHATPSGTENMTLDTDYTYKVVDPSDGIPVITSDGTKSVTFEFTPVDGVSGNYSGSKQIVQTLSPTFYFFFDDVSEIKDEYVEKVTITTDGGYQLSLDNATYYDSLVYDTIGDKQTVSLYVKNPNNDVTFKITVPHTITIVKRSMSDVTVTSDFSTDDIFTLNYKDETDLMVEGTDYILEGVPEDGIFEVGKEYEITFKAVENGKYKDSISKKFTIPARTLLFNDSPAGAAGIVYAAVRIIVKDQDGYKISKKEEVAYKSSVEYLSTSPYNLQEDHDVYIKHTDYSKYGFLQTFTVKFDIESINKTSVKVSDIDYLAAKPYTLTYEDEGTSAMSMVEGEDGDYIATLTKPSDGIPVADGSTENTYCFEGKNRFNAKRDVGFTIPKSLNFNDSTEMNAGGYTQSVILTGPSGYSISLSAEGDYQDSIELTYDKEKDRDKEYDPFTVYLRRNLENRVVTIKQEVKGLKVVKPPYVFEDFFPDGESKVATGLIYSGKAQNLFETFKTPTAPSGVTIVESSKEDSFTGTDAKKYRIRYEITYRYQGATITIFKDYGQVEIAKKFIGDVITLSDKVKKTKGGNLDFVASGVDFKTEAFTLMNGEVPLKENTDYKMTITPDLPADGTLVYINNKYEVVFDANNSNSVNQNYSGQAKYTIEIAELEGFTYNSSTTKEDAYFEVVEIGAPDGCQISLTQKDEDFVDSFIYDEIGDNQKIAVYVKNKKTGRYICQTLKDITVKHFQILYDDSPSMNNPYYENVKISAVDFEVSTSRGGSYTNSYICTKAGKYPYYVVPDFSLFFKHKITQQVLEVKVSGLVIKKDIDLPVLYNGDKYKEWFNTDVTLTCDGYKMRDASGKDTDPYTDTFKVTGEGTHKYTLDFQNKNDTTDIQSYEIVIRIDQTAPTGSLTVDNYKQPAWNTTDGIVLNTNKALEIKMEGKDEGTVADGVSGFDHIEYWLDESFYDSTAALEKAGPVWRMYSSSNIPKLRQDKKNYAYVAIYDKAGNVTYISSKAMIYDTIAPVMSIISGAMGDDKIYTVALEGTDSLSGMEYFAWLCKEVTSGMKAPTAAEILANKDIVLAEGDPGQKVSANLYISDLDKKKDYIAYVIAVDKAGTYSGIKTYYIYGENSGSIGTISVADYKSNTFQTEDKPALYTNTSKNVTITASKSGPGFSAIEYFVSDTFTGNPSEVEKMITDKKSSWSTYSSSYPVTLTKDKKNYVYARFTSKNGSYYYLSTGCIYYDTVAPKMAVNTVDKTDKEGEYKVVLGGSDDMSGINRFKLLIQEKTADKMDPPEKDYIFNMGTYIEVTKEEKLVAGATYTAKELEASKTYMFWFAAVDRAGNISDITSQEVKGEDSKDKDKASGSGSGSGSGGSGSGLTPAPNGLAGSGTSKGGNKTSGTGKSKTTDTKKNPLGDKDREISRDPYIADATGSVKIGKNETSGWDKISSEVSKADKGTVLEVDMSGTSQVPSKLFSSMQGKDVDIKLKMADGVMWDIKGSSIAPGNAADMDMGVKLGSRNIPDKVVADIADTYPHVEFSTTGTGPLGFEAGIIIPVDKMNKGMNATLYRYDAESKELLMEGTSVVDENGNVEFDISEAGDYTVIISPEKATEKTDSVVVSGSDSYGTHSVGGSTIQLTDIFSKRGGTAMWLFFMALVSALLCVAILFAPTFQEKKDDEFKNLM